MATSRMLRGVVLVLTTVSLLAVVPGRASARGRDGADAALRPATVAYYDEGAVLAGSRTFAARRAEIERLEARYGAEAAPIESEVDELRGELRASVSWPASERRVVETRLAARTIALLVLRSEAGREIERARSALEADADRRIVAAVARVVGERALPVVVRVDASTRVLDDDAVDLTPLVIGALDAEPGAVPPDEELMERRRTRLQSCDVAAPAAPRDVDKLRARSARPSASERGEWTPRRARPGGARGRVTPR